MPEQNTPTLNFSFRYDLGETGWKNGYDNNWRLLEVLLRGSVISASTSAQPGSPSNGDLYIVPSNGSGSHWATRREKLAYFDGTESGGTGNWIFFTPVQKMRIFAIDENQPYVFDGSIWEYESESYPGFSESLAYGSWYIHSLTGALTKKMPE